MKSILYSVKFFPVMFFGIFTLVVLVSCASKQIEVKHFKGYAEVYEGEEARLEWSFKNAEKVRVEGLPNYYEPTDVVYVKPEQTTKYNIIAYRGRDSVVVTSRVNVKTITKPKGIRRGSTFLKSMELKPSYLETEYFNGVIEGKATKGPVNLKVMRTIYSKESQNTFTLRALLLDEFGNYVTGTSKIDNKPRWKAENTCEGIKSLQLIRDYSETFMNSQNLDLGIVMDNSAAAETNSKVYEMVKEFVQYLSPTDNIMFSVFNHNYNELLSLMPAEQALSEFESLELPTRFGLNAMYKAAQKSLQSLKAGENPMKALVILTYNADNSSVIYNANDVLQTAREYNIPVYVIAVGTSVNTFILKYITQSTGARLYTLLDDGTAKIQDILKEIWFAQKSFYELKVTIPNEYKECKSLRTTVSCEMGDNRVLETANLIIKPLMPYSLYQSIGCFDYRSSDIPADYIENISSLAKYLKSNSNLKIELIGHSSIEGNMTYNNEVSLGRAEKVKDLLVKEGVSASQVKTKGEGCCKPLYCFEQLPWQSNYNRRVEVRWLDPKSLPYEIIAENVETENDANHKSEVWESLGYRSYYERYMQNNVPSYRVKIWGYGSYDEATNRAKELEKKYRHGFLVE